MKITPKAARAFTPTELAPTSNQLDQVCSHVLYNFYVLNYSLSCFYNKDIPIKCFVSRHPPAREGGSVGWVKKKM